MHRLNRTTLLISLLLLMVSVADAAPQPKKSAIPSIMRILKSGRIKQAQLGTVIDLVCRRGNAFDLGYVFDRATRSDKKLGSYSSELRLRVFKGLAKAARNRKVAPEEHRTKLKPFISNPKPGKVTGELQQSAIHLAGLWKTQELAKSVAAVVTSKQRRSVRKLALTSLIQIDAGQARQIINRLDSANRSQADRLMAISALVTIDAKEAARRAGGILAKSGSTIDPAPLIEAFLGRKGASVTLANALEKIKLREDTAKLALRYMFSVGRSDARLNQVLDKHAGIDALAKPLTKQQVKALAAKVLAKGNPARGEQIFRRQDLSCMKCHSVSKAGGNVGPDLSAVGSSTPVDYLINSILLPSQAIKEQYHSTVVVTADGDVYTGIIVDKAGDQLVIRDANGKETSIPKDDIEEQQKGRSLMPKGLAKFMTRQELMDLVRFLSLLGKPGVYAVRTKQTIQRWRVLQQVPDEVLTEIPDKATLESAILQRTESAWRAAYGRVAGTLPLDELKSSTKNNVLVVRGAVQATSGGQALLKIDSPAGVTAWIGSDRVRFSRSAAKLKLKDGRNQLTFRIDRSRRKSPALQVEVARIAGSSAQFVVVGGR